MADIVTNTAASASTQTSTQSAPRVGSGLHFERHFTKPGVSPFDELTWEKRDAVIQDFKG